MSLGLRLRVTNTADGTVLERTFERFPVRIGRNPLSDLQLDFPYVSQFHCTLELQGRQLLLRDLGSRNGTYLRNQGKIDANALVDLAVSNYEFAVSGLLFQAFPAELAPKVPQAVRMRGSTFAVDPAAAQALRDEAFGASAEAKRELKPLIEAYRSAWAQVTEKLQSKSQGLSAAQKAQLVQGLANDHPALAQEPDFQRIAQLVGVTLANSGGAGATGRDDAMALQALKELAASYVPNKPLEGANDIVLFLAKLQGVLDVFFKAFIPLRDGYKQFQSKMELRRAPTARSLVPTAAVMVESATDGRQLSASVLDWRDRENEGPRAIESTFADLMIHQVALLDGIMRGVKSMLDELSPKSIEALADKKKVGGFGPFRFEKLWEVYKERHSDLADEEKEAFGLIFGPQFVQAYNQFSRDTGGGGQNPRGLTAVGSGAPQFPPAGGGPHKP
ncbi:MAG: FHA domain-containing protein [Myxococcales bacterium]|nr:FHA domain-containing protein [Myxococcales bacterium]